MTPIDSYGPPGITADTSCSMTPRGVALGLVAAIPVWSIIGFALWRLG